MTTGANITWLAAVAQVAAMVAACSGAQFAASTADAGAGAGAADGGAGGGPDGAAGGDASVPAVDAAPGADGCAAIEQPRVGSDMKMACAPRGTHERTIDGSPSEWDEVVAPLVLDSTTARLFRAQDGGATPPSARFRLAWTPGFLYVLAQVTDPKRYVDNATDPSRNDSVEIYVGASPRPTCSYGPAEHHYAIDANGVPRDYDGIAIRAPSPTFSSATEPTTDGYWVEVRIPASDLGLAAFTAGTKLRFDLMVNDGPEQSSFALWESARYNTADCTESARCCCSGNTPACNTLVFGGLTLR